MFIEELLTFSRTLKDCERKIIDLILGLDEKLIDDYNSIIKESSEYITISLLSINDLNCPFQIQIGRATNCHKINLSLGSNAEVYSLEDFSSPKDCEAILEDLRTYLTSEISEIVYMVNEAPAKATYRVLNANVAGLKVMIFTKYYRTIWFWMKKDVRIKNYLPWSIK